MTNGKTRELGFIAATALVMGNMIGSGVYLLPASLAPYGGVAIIGWVASAIGAVLLALVFARLAAQAPAAGGPQAYARMAFGDFAGFVVAWVYWFSVWSGNAAIAVAFAGYTAPFIPVIGTNPMYGAGLAIAALWVVSIINIIGIREAGRVQVITTVLKILPLLLIGFVGLFVLNGSHFAFPQVGGGAIGRDIFTTVTLTLWAFVGLDAATIPAGHVRDPSRTIPRATFLGTTLAATIYIVSTVAVMGIVAPATLATTTAPFAVAARALFGGPAALLVAAGAAISAFGALNGWTLIGGQIPQAAARDGMFPEWFSPDSKGGTPARAIIVTSMLGTILIAANYTRGLVGLFTFIILLATLGALIPYAFSAVAGFILARRADPSDPNAVRVPRSHTIIGAFAFIYVLIAMAGAGYETVYWGFFLTIIAIPLYAWLVLSKRKRSQT